MAKLELYGTASCPYTQDMRDWLDLTHREFEEYDVEADSGARERMKTITGQRMVPVLVEDGKPVQIGWHGRGCII